MFGILGSSLATVGVVPMEKILGAGVCLVAILGCIQIILSIPKRIAFHRDAEPKLILSHDAFCDQRTGLMIELMDVEIRSTVPMATT